MLVVVVVVVVIVVKGRLSPGPLYIFVGIAGS